MEVRRGRFRYATDGVVYYDPNKNKSASGNGVVRINVEPVDLRYWSIDGGRESLPISGDTWVYIGDVAVGIVFGGGMEAQAVVTGNTYIEITDTNDTSATIGNIRGGGWKADVKGNTTVICERRDPGNRDSFNVKTSPAYNNTLSPLGEMDFSYEKASIHGGGGGNNVP